MDIKFIWIKEHRLLKDLNFNFCHDGLHNFEYTNDKIVIKKKQDYPIDFGNNITNITGIAGKNGSGKSSFCEIVLASTATLQNGSFGFNYLFDGIVCYGDHFFIQNDLTVTNEKELIDLDYKIVRYNESPFEEMKHEWRFSFAKGGFIYYSNFLDRKSAQGENNLVNISTQNSLLEDGYYSTYPVYRLRSGNSNEDVGIDKYTQYESHIIQEDFRNLRFITKFPELVPFFGDHTRIALHASYSGNNRFVDIKDPLSKISSYIDELERSIFIEVYPSWKDDNNTPIKFDQEKYKNLILRLYKLNLIAVTVNSDAPDINSDEIRKYVFEDIIPNYLKDRDIEDLVKTYNELLSKGEMIEEFNPQTWQWRFGKAKDWRFYVLQHIYVPLNSETILLFEKLIDLEDKVLDSEKYSIRRISNYTIYPYLSSGQSSFLSLFSRLYDVILRNENGYDNREKLILFLDEAEVGFHPEWSRKFLKQLTDFLNMDFNKYKFQIILTTHNPYILSDLPSENVKLFNQVGDSSPTISKPKTETFGANIYDLFTDSFFLENGFIGEFAKEKIDMVFKDLILHVQNQIKISEVRQEEIFQIISIVGEPLIKRQLSKLYDQAFRSNLEIKVIDDQIEKLREVKNRIQKRNDSN